MNSLNKELLNFEVQDFITKNINSDISKLILKGTPFSNIKTNEIVEQIEAKKKCATKLKSWFKTKNIYYPNKLNIEQTSSEITANYKATLISGETLIDATGGFGVDCFSFSKTFKTVTHCEINPVLSKIVAHNYKQFKVSNIKCINQDGIKAIETSQKTYDWIYIDPSRRNDIKEKVFLLKDCLPNVPKYLTHLFNTSNNILVKTSPLLDITLGLKELKHVKTIHIIALNNEVKELLWHLEKKHKNEIEIKTVNLTKNKDIHLSFKLNEEFKKAATLSSPLNYLYEPNAAILKSGGFNILANQLNISKLHQHSHLYTSKTLIDFPGRCFKILNNIVYNKKVFKKVFKYDKANVTTRNFPDKVEVIRKKLNLKDGGDNYLFFTTDSNNQKIILICKKV